MSKQVVRNLRSGATHLADVSATTAATQFGSVYRRPPDDTVAYCGVKIENGVVMQSGTRIKCRACVRLDQHVQDVHESADPMPLVEQVVREECRNYNVSDDHPLEALADRIVARLREVEPS